MVCSQARIWKVVTQINSRGVPGCPGHTHLLHKHSHQCVFLVHRLIVRWVCVWVDTSTAGYTEPAAGQSQALWARNEDGISSQGVNNNDNNNNNRK